MLCTHLADLPLFLNLLYIPRNFTGHTGHGYTLTVYNTNKCINSLQAHTGLSLQQGEKETTAAVSDKAPLLSWGRSDTTNMKLILISMRSLYLLSYHSNGQMPSRGKAQLRT